MGTAEVTYSVMGYIVPILLVFTISLLLINFIASYFYHSFLLTSDALLAITLSSALSAPSVVGAEVSSVEVKMKNVKDLVLTFPVDGVVGVFSKTAPTFAPAISVKRITEISVVADSSCGAGGTARVQKKSLQEIAGEGDVKLIEGIEFEDGVPYLAVRYFVWSGFGHYQQEKYLAPKSYSTAINFLLPRYLYIPGELTGISYDNSGKVVVHVCG